MQRLGWQLLRTGTEHAGLCRALNGNDSRVDRLLTGEGGKGRPGITSEHTDFLSMYFPSNITGFHHTNPISISYMQQEFYLHRYILLDTSKLPDVCQDCRKFDPLYMIYWCWLCQLDCKNAAFLIVSPSQQLILYLKTNWGDLLVPN